MSALGSSVINKSGKKFAPKAPARRPAAPTSTQTSARPSVDRQIHSQTPQPYPLPQQAASSPTPSKSLPTSIPPQQQVIVAPAKSTREDGGTPISQPSRRVPVQETSTQQGRATSIPIPSRNPRSQSHISPAPVVAQQEPPELHNPSIRTESPQSPKSRRALEPVISSAASNGPNLMYSDFTSSPQPPSTSREGQASPHNNETTASIAPSPGISQKDTQAPAAKRRRLEKPLGRSQAVRFPTSEANANVPIPSTELDEVEPGASGDANTGSAPSWSTNPKGPRLSAQERRKQQIEDAAAEVVTDASRGVFAKSKKPRKNAKEKGVQRGDRGGSEARAGPSAGSSGHNDQIAVPAKPKRKRTKRNPNQSIEDAAAEVIEDAVQGSSKKPKRPGRKRRREVTPEGADAAVISPSKVKMSELCKDNRIGRKSEREKDLEEFERAEFVRKKQKELQEVMGQAGPEGQAESSETSEARLERLGRQREQEESVANNVPNTIIVNGQIQIDEDSLQIDRHAGAAAERDAEHMEAVDETDLTRKVNSASWLKREKGGGWNELLTERFYDGLRMFGTDFQMISKMFPGRTRHKIKLKFVKEEKFNPDRIQATLLGEQVPVDLPELEKMAGVEFDDPKVLEEEMEEDRKRLEEETLAEKQAIDEARKEREDQIAAERAAAGEESSAKENRRGKNKRKKGEKQEGDKSSSKRKEKRANKAGASGEANVLVELGDIAGT